MKKYKYGISLTGEKMPTAQYNCIDCGRSGTRRLDRMKKENRCRTCAVSLAHKGVRGFVHSEVSKKKISASKAGAPSPHKGRKFGRLSPATEFKKGQIPWNKGIRTPEAALNKRVHNCCSGMIRRVLKIRDEKKVRKTFDYLGYTKSDFVKHIEALFRDGMSWENYGKWQVDHIKPVSQYASEGVLDVKVINALSNLQPLWRDENLKKRIYKYKERKTLKFTPNIRRD